MGIGSLDTALSGLRVAQQQLNTIATNVSNVGTAGYTRKILPQETIALGGAAVSVRANSIIRNVDLNLERDLWTQVSSVSFLDVQATYLNRIQEFHGPPDLNISIAAELSELHDSFIALSDSPEDSFLQRGAVDQAKTVSNKINDLANLISQMRNDAQDDLEASVTDANRLLETIAELNGQISQNVASGRTTAALEDSRDRAIKDLSEEIEISFFTRGNGVMVIQTAEGVQLADEHAEELFFNLTPAGPTSYYPDSLSGLWVGGDPASNSSAINITETDLNGKMGALIDLRDTVLPRQQALLDELAHKLAQRFNAQGLMLFTDASGAIPLDTAPDPLIDPPLAVEYVGFSSEIQVSASIINDNSLVQSGTATTDAPVHSGSNEVIHRVVDFVFGDVAYQQATGTNDLRASGAGTTMQEWLGIFSDNQITSTLDLTAYTDISALVAAGGTVFAGPPVNDQFTLTFEETRTAPPLGPTTITIDLTDADANFPIGAPGINDALDQIVAEINNQVVLAGVPAGLAVQASSNGNGQLIIQSRGNIDIDASFAGGMNQDGLDFLGLTEGSYTTTDPYIDVQIGNDPPVRVTIEPGEDETDLEAKLDKINATDPGVAGLAENLDAGTGFLTLRPGDDTAAPGFGGDIKIVGGPFQADGSGTIPGGLIAGSTLINALFGTDTPITNVSYASLTSTGASVSFRVDELGASANIDTGIIGSSTLIDYAQKLVNRQSEEINTIESRREDESSFRDLLNARFLDDSGVNLDEELSNLIIVQTAYSAAARVITAIDQQLQELLRAI